MLTSHVIARRRFEQARRAKHDDVVSSKMLAEYVALHNHGVATGDFEPMLRLFAPDAEIRFRTLQIGPFRGVDAIRSAFAENPPDDALIMLGPIRESADGAITDYAWDAVPGQTSGTLQCKVGASDLIQSLEIS